MLYARMLGVIGSNEPDRVLGELLIFGRDPDEEVRSLAISSLMAFPIDISSQLREALIALLANESNIKIQDKIKKTLKRYQIS